MAANSAAQYENVAEALVRAAYLAVGTSEPIKEQIRNDPREPDYGSLITALSSVGQLNSIQGECRVLRDLRSSKSEVPHAGEQPDADDMATARRCFKKVATVTVGTLDSARRAAKT